VTQARQYFMLGVQEYDAGNFAQAESEFETAYSYSAHAAVLFNIAAALEHAGRIEEALDVYERYADTRPPNESIIRKKIEALRKP
jgi:tetratricopeptide (TPR) repeat protein